MTGEPVAIVDWWPSGLWECSFANDAGSRTFVPALTATGAMAKAEHRFGPLRWEPGDTPHTYWGFAT